MFQLILFLKLKEIKATVFMLDWRENTTSIKNRLEIYNFYRTAR